MKILFTVQEVAKVRDAKSSSTRQRLDLHPVPDAGDGSVDGFASRPLQLVVTNPADFLPESVEPGDVVALSLRVYDKAQEGGEG